MSSEHRGHFWQCSEVFWKLLEIFGCHQDFSGNPSHDKVKISCIWLRKSWQVYTVCILAGAHQSGYPTVSDHWQRCFKCVWTLLKLFWILLNKRCLVTVDILNIVKDGPKRQMNLQHIPVYWQCVLYCICLNERPTLN